MPQEQLELNGGYSLSLPSSPESSWCLANFEKIRDLRSHGCGWPDDRFCGGSHRLSPRGVVAWYKLYKVYMFLSGAMAQRALDPAQGFGYSGTDP